MYDRKRAFLLNSIFLLALGAPATGAAQSWQQGVRYELDARLDTTAHELQTYMRCVYTNHSPDTLHKIYFQIPANAFHDEKNTAMRELRRFNQGNVRIEQLGQNKITIHSVQFLSIGAEHSFPIQAYDFTDTILQLALPVPLMPGDSLALGMAFTQKREKTYELWFPRVAVYDENGWEVEPFHFLMAPDDVYSEFAVIDVTITVPGNYIVVAQGELLEGDPGWQAVQIDTTKSDSTFQADDDSLRNALREWAQTYGPRRLRFRAAQAHNFIWSASPKYRYLPVQAGVPLHLFSKGWRRDGWGPGILKNLPAALSFVTSYFGPYPGERLLIAHGEGDVVGQTGIMFLGSDDAFELVMAMAKAYIPGVLATNGFREGWMGRGLAVYLGKAFAEKIYGKLGYDEKEAKKEQDWIERRYPLPSIDAVLRNFALLYKNSGQDEGIANTASGYKDPLSALFNQYLKSELFFDMLEYVLGRDTFRQALHKFYAENRYRHVTSEDFQAVCERVSGQDLDWFFQQWLQGTPTIDYAKSSVRKYQRDDTTWVTEVEIQRRGDGVMPVDVALDLVEGKKMVQRWNGRDRLGKIVFETREKPGKVIVDPDDRILDNNVLNNRDIRLEFRPDLPFMKFLHMPPDAYLVLWRPDLGYNDVDGIRLGFKTSGSYRAFFHNLDVSFLIGLKTGSIDGRIAYSHPIRRSNLFNRYHVMARKNLGRYELDAHLVLRGAGGVLSASGRSLTLGISRVGVLDRKYTFRWLANESSRTRITDWDKTTVTSLYLHARAQAGTPALSGELSGSVEYAPFGRSNNFGVAAMRAHTTALLAGVRMALGVHAAAAFGADMPPLQYQPHAEGASPIARFREDVLATGNKATAWSRWYVEGGGGLRGYAGQPLAAERYGTLTVEIGPNRHILGVRIAAFYDRGTLVPAGGKAWQNRSDAGVMLRLLGGRSLLFGGNLPLFENFSIRLYLPLWLSDPLPGEDPVEWRWYISLGKSL